MISQGVGIQQASTWNLCNDPYLVQNLSVALQGYNLPFCLLPVPGKCWNASIMCYQTMLLMMTNKICANENRSMVTGLER
ncbi:MAG TPA: hypothetical protein DDY16_09730 [Tenacibaculum sp.]|nr:hypothetical protein [Tenacibaculum sp.]HBI41204.1 hypothetical protein [Tenacibaculum sp.]